MKSMDLELSKLLGECKAHLHCVYKCKPHTSGNSLPNTKSNKSCFIIHVIKFRAVVRY